MGAGDRVRDNNGNRNVSNIDVGTDDDGGGKNTIDFKSEYDTDAVHANENYSTTTAAAAAATTATTMTNNNKDNHGCKNNNNVNNNVNVSGKNNGTGNNIDKDNDIDNEEILDCTEEVECLGIKKSDVEYSHVIIDLVDSDSGSEEDS